MLGDKNVFLITLVSLIFLINDSVLGAVLGGIWISHISYLFIIFVQVNSSLCVIAKGSLEGGKKPH